MASLFEISLNVFPVGRSPSTISKGFILALSQALPLQLISTKMGSHSCAATFSQTNKASFSFVSQLTITAILFAIYIPQTPFTIVHE